MTIRGGAKTLFGNIHVSESSDKKDAGKIEATRVGTASSSTYIDDLRKFLGLYLRHLGAQGAARIHGVGLDFGEEDLTGRKRMRYRLFVDEVTRHNGTAYFAHAKGEILSWNKRVICRVTNLRVSVSKE